MPRRKKQAAEVKEEEEDEEGGSLGGTARPIRRDQLTSCPETPFRADFAVNISSREPGLGETNTEESSEYVDYHTVPDQFIVEGDDISFENVQIVSLPINGDQRGDKGELTYGFSVEYHGSHSHLPLEGSGESSDLVPITPEDVQDEEDGIQTPLISSKPVSIESTQLFPSTAQTTTRTSRRTSKSATMPRYKRPKHQPKLKEPKHMDDRLSHPIPPTHREEALLIPHGLKPFTVPINPYPLYLLFRFIKHRHEMYERRRAGAPRDRLTDDETMKGMIVGNVFRELDRGSIRFKEEVLGVGDQSLEEVCFRVFLFCGFYEFKTYGSLVEGLGYPPRWSTFERDLPKYEAILHTRSFDHNLALYTSGFQIVPPTRYFGIGSLPHYAATLRFVKVLMDLDLPHRLKQCEYAVDASKLLQSIPTLGAFLSLNILVYLNDSTHFNFQYRTYASCGPGSRRYIQRIFGTQIRSVGEEESALKWLYDNQFTIWNRLGGEIPFASDLDGMKPGLRCLDFENAMCWCERYVSSYTKKNLKSLADLPLPDFNESSAPGIDVSDEPSWCVNQHDVTSVNQKTEDNDGEVKGLDVDDEKQLEDVYEVEKIIARTGNKDDKDGIFRIRWKGYSPEEDTWERASGLRIGANEVLSDWLEWENSILSTFENVKSTLKWVKPTKTSFIMPKEGTPLDEGLSLLPEQVLGGDNSIDSPSLVGLNVDSENDQDMDIGRCLRNRQTPPNPHVQLSTWVKSKRLRQRSTASNRVKKEQVDEEDISCIA